MLIIFNIIDNGPYAKHNYQGMTNMKIINIFHYISHARWIFLIWMLFLLVQIFINPIHYALSNTGLVVFLAGLFLGFLGFSDIEKLSKKDKKDFSNPKTIKIGSIFILFWAGFIFISGIYFMNIRLIKPGIKENMATEIKTVGYHCFALGFGFLCYLKLMFDKYKYYQSLPEDKKTSCSSDPAIHDKL
jgi:hypothetical protein